MIRGVVLRLAVAALLAALAAGCAQLRSLFGEEGLRLYDEWTAMIEEIRAFEERIGFTETVNFLSLSDEKHAYPFCGHVSQQYLPYSYEDPAIRWRNSISEEECRTAGEGTDIFFGSVEVWGESATPVTPAMLASSLDRFLYLVIHENCHDQFELPYGIEEALCNIIAYHGMVQFSEEKFGPLAREHAVIRRYAEQESKRTHLTTVFYSELERLYARFERKELSPVALLGERARIFGKAERALARKQGSLNNVVIANDMTYSRHFPFLEDVFDALGRDLARTVAFFKRVDTLKPTRARVKQEHGFTTDEGVDFIRAYEAAIVETIERALREERRAK